MRRLDILILKSFIGPFFLTTAIATFILLIQYMLKYFDDFVGKDLGFMVFAELLFYFSLNMLQVALPLGVLVSSLMTFGNLGENFELTAIKGAGISLIRALRPIFIYVLILSLIAFYFNDRVVPAANLKAYSLLYDIKHKKPALDIKQGVFYDGIPKYSIKVGEKFSDNQTLKNVMIYDHQRRDGNRRLILSDSAKMFTIYNEKFLKLELFDGHYYNELNTKGSEIDQFQRTAFDRLDMVFSLSSFDLKRTKEELFQNNRQMKNISELTRDIDSLSNEQILTHHNLVTKSELYLKFHFQPLEAILPEDTVQEEEIGADSTLAEAGILNLSALAALFQDEPDTLKRRPRLRKSIRETIAATEPVRVKDKALDSLTMVDLNKLLDGKYVRNQITHYALAQARNFKVTITSQKVKMDALVKAESKYKIEKFKKYSQAFACIVMFLIGAPLGAIIKKGGLGVPVIVSIFFFIIYYVLTITGEKWAKAGLIDGQYAVWIADLSLLPFGLFFLRQARIDARLFDTDFYLVVLDKIKSSRLLKRS